MSIEIAGVRYATKRPDDLDAQLVTTTGCDSGEIEQLLVSGADRVAAALRPFLPEDAPTIVELANAIAGDPDAIGQIRTLYAIPPASPALIEEA